MTKPIDRLPYADSAYMESQLSGRGTAQLAVTDGAGHAGASPGKPAPCPVCLGRGRGRNLSAEKLDALQLGFWSADGRQFDHIGFARAVMAACGD